MRDPGELWSFLIWGYLATVAIETPVLAIGLSKPHPLRRRLFAGVWLTACTYPMVVLVLPLLIEDPFGRSAYLAVAETFAPAAECVLFYAAFGRDAPPSTKARVQDCVAIVLANLASFLPIELLRMV